MSAKLGTIVILCALGLAAVPSVQASNFTGSATGTASVWASFHAVTCSNWETASFSASYADGIPYQASSSNADFRISVNSNTLTYTSSAAAPCNAQSMPVLDYSVDCAAGTAVIDAAIPGQIGVSIQVSGVSCSGLLGSGLVCFAYNPDALTNVCITEGQQPENVPTATPVVGSQTVGVPTPVVGTTTQTVCLIGPECVNAPVPHAGVGSTPETIPDVSVQRGTQVVEVPTVGGYVEVTACGTSLCHVDL